MKKFLLILAVLILAGVGVYFWYEKAYAETIARDQEVKVAWALLENELQRRNDLIPNIMNVVKEEATLEVELYREIQRLRNQWMMVETVREKIHAASDLSAMIAKLISVIERIPKLRGDKEFNTDLEQLRELEQRINKTQADYNREVAEFNAYQDTILGGFVVSTAGIEGEKPHYKPVPLSAAQL